MQLKLGDRAILQRWCMLCLKIAAARSKREPVTLGNDGAAMVVVNEDNVFRSRGYIALTNWYKALSPGARARTRIWMHTTLTGIAKLEEKVRAEGDEFDYAELELDIRAAAKDDGLEVVGPDDVERNQKEKPTDGE